MEEIPGISPITLGLSNPESQEQLGSDNSILQVNIFVEYKCTSRVKTLPQTFTALCKSSCLRTVSPKLLGL